MGPWNAVKWRVFRAKRETQEGVRGRNSGYFSFCISTEWAIQLITLPETKIAHQNHHLSWKMPCNLGPAQKPVTVGKESIHVYHGNFIDLHYPLSLIILFIDQGLLYVPFWWVS